MSEFTVEPLAYFRTAPFQPWAYLKFFEAPARTLYDRLTAPSVVASDEGGVLRRAGRDVLVRSPTKTQPVWVAELRFLDATRTLAPPQEELLTHHAFVQDRDPGWARWVTPDRLVITGLAAVGWQRWRGVEETGVVVVTLVDGASGQVRVEGG